MSTALARRLARLEDATSAVQRPALVPLVPQGAVGDFRAGR